MTTLVTGGMGFTGRLIVENLVAAGRRVINYNRDYSEQNTDLVTQVQGELYDITRLVRTFEKYRVERVIHTAAMSHPSLSIEMPVATVSANIEGTVSLFEAMRLAGVQRIVNLSSQTVYGHVDGVVSEQTPAYPTTPYGVTKLANDHFGRVYQDTYGLAVFSLRVSEVYGPGNKMPQILMDIIKTVLRGKAYVAPRGGDHLYHFIHAHDVARAVILAADAPADAAGIYNVAGDRSWKLREAVELIRNELPGARIEIGPGYGDLNRHQGWDQSAAAAKIGYVAEITLPRGLHEYIKWLNYNQH